MVVPIRKLRHWKQRYDANAAFILRRRMKWGAKTYEPGEHIPKELAANKAKLRRFWEAGWIELAEFHAPDVATGQAEPKLLDGVVMERRGSWYVVTMVDGSVRKALGRKAWGKLLAELGDR